MFVKKILGVIGCGHMGSAIAENLSPEGIFEKIYVLDKDKKKADFLVRSFGVHPAATCEDLSLRADVILIAVKPQDCDEVFGYLKGISGKLIISIAAGMPLAYMEARLDGAHMRLVRAMPNLNALVAASVTALAVGRGVSQEDTALSAKLFGAIGETVVVREEVMNAVTAISGSGPAFVAYLLDSLNEEEMRRIFLEEALGLGIEKKVAQVLVNATIRGTQKSLAVNFDREMLIKRVCSKGGTTEAGMKVLASGGKTAGALSGAIRAAFRRATELSKS